MDFAINVVIPTAQAFIMFSLGLGLSIADFQRVFSRKTAFAVGAVCQVVILPLMAFAVATLLNLPPIMAAGLMILSFCPGGVTSNIITKLSCGDVAMSVSLTAVVSVLSFITVPPLVTWAVLHFMGEAAPDFSFIDIAFFTFLLTTVPVTLGVLVRHFLPKLAIAIERPVEIIAIIFWVVIVGGVFYGNRAIIVELMPVLGPSLFILPIGMMLVGLILSRAFGLTGREGKTVGVEASIQNSPLGITLATVLMGGISATSNELAMPSAMYSVTMYLVAISFIFLFRFTDADRRSVPAE
ncbi:bile acid transporter [Ruegeria sp. THAF57]|uniref:bile acid:sodium symporter family protein n=1 Tax=Ruegeria sp. THAF57 TaxID=2744555 RepID=UPI0015DDAC49|nr:bile acid:sodium symporter family protein [Ruegeria sp. THAF57]CAD0187226.1 bile acid transporter [Ruegeria sp. THAF57]